MSARILAGAPVAEALERQMRTDVEALAAAGVTPLLAILRVGERKDDLSYERGAARRCERVGVGVQSVALPGNVDAGRFFDALEALNRDPAVHGILLLRPLPSPLDNEAARRALNPQKDVDGCTDASLAGVFTGQATGFAPCTAQACLALLDHYGVELRGRRVVVVGRSLVVGRPLALLLMQRDATVTVCHTKTEELPSVTRGADVVIAACGRTESLGRECFRPGQTVVDVGVGWSEEKQKLCGDVRFEEAEAVVDAVTPVPGGVGAVTSAVLVGHVIEAAKRRHG